MMPRTWVVVASHTKVALFEGDEALEQLEPCGNLAAEPGDLAACLVRRLAELHARGAFDEVVLAAPPAVLWSIHRELATHRELAAAVRAEIDHDLTPVPPPRLPDALAPWLESVHPPCS